MIVDGDLSDDDKSRVYVWDEEGLEQVKFMLIWMYLRTSIVKPHFKKAFKKRNI